MRQSTASAFSVLILYDEERGLQNIMEKKMRINKYLSAAGVCSRREADRQIAAGNVRIGEKTAQIADLVSFGEPVYFQGRLVKTEQERILLVVNKPKGIVCTAQKKEKNNIVDFLQYPKRIYPVGRLDKQSEGLILMTNEGDFVNKIMRSGNRHEKEYLVTVNKTVTDAFLDGLAGGVPVLGTMTRKCKVERTGKRSFRIVLTQGMNRQIRRMCEYFDYRVVSLKRVRIMNIHLGDLPSGAYRSVTAQELERLEQMLAGSCNDTVRFESSADDQQLWEEEE